MASNIRSRSISKDRIKTLLPSVSCKELKTLIAMDSKSRKKIMLKLESIREATSAASLRLRILESDLPEPVALEALKEVEDYCDGDTTKYVDALLRVPRTRHPVEVESLGDFLRNGRRVLDRCTRGQEELKLTLMQVISERVTSPEARPVALGIHGPAGVGKTALIRNGLAKVLNLPFQTVSLGGLSDAAHMVGFDRTYAGSTYGRLASIAISSACTNPVIFFDELDKISDTASGVEIANILIHLTDPEGSDTVTDKYLGPIDLRGATLVFAYNDPSMVSPILRSRLREVAVRGYSDKEKFAIATEHLMPSIRKELDISPGLVCIGDSLVEHLVARCADERGVRTLRQHLAAMYQAARVAVATEGEVMLGIPTECMVDGGTRCVLDLPIARDFCKSICGGEPEKMSHPMYI